MEMDVKLIWINIVREGFRVVLGNCKEEELVQHAMEDERISWNKGKCNRNNELHMLSSSYAACMCNRAIEYKWIVIWLSLRHTRYELKIVIFLLWVVLHVFYFADSSLDTRNISGGNDIVDVVLWQA